MKKILIASVCTFPFTIYAASSVTSGVSDLPVYETIQKSEFQGLVGLGIVNHVDFPGVKDDSTDIVPLINVDYQDTYYFQFNKLGAWVYKSNDTGFRLGVVAQPRQGYDKGDGPLINNEVDDTFNVGLRAKWQLGKLSIDASYLASTESDSGSESHINFNYNFIFSKQGTLSAFVRAEGLSEDAVDYLYYDQGQFEGADSTVNASIGIVATYAISPKWSVLTSVSATTYGNEIKDAPGVTEDNSTTAVIGALYKF